MTAVQDERRTKEPSRQPLRFQCVVCLQLDAEALYDACPACKARLFGEYVAVRGGL